MNLPAAILCGGKATRLYPLTEDQPKALIEIAGEPFLAHQLRLLKRAGIDRVVLCAGHLAGMLMDYAGDGSRFGMVIDYSLDGPLPLGTAGALKRALPRLGEEFFVLYGDSYLVCDYQAAARRFRESGKLALMTVFANHDRFDRSNVAMGPSGEILAYDKHHRTTAMRHIDYGLGLFQARAFDRVPPNEPLDLALLYQQLLQAGELAACEVAERFYEIGSFEGIHELENLLRS